GGVAAFLQGSQFHPHVYWADGLEQVEKGMDIRGQQLDLLDDSKGESVRANLTRGQGRAALARVLEPKFHVVVANPPYILERDDTRKAYHREMIGKRRRYISAAGKYSLAAPFAERSFQLAMLEGFVGLIASNNFMKREFGKPLIEHVLAAIDLTLV